MRRVATYMLVKEGKEEAYREAHRHVWPEILEGARKAGIRNYTIFMMGRQLFSYFEVDDLEQATKMLANDPISQKWQAMMAPLMEVGSGIRDGSTVYLEEVFHFD